MGSEAFVRRREVFCSTARSADYPDWLLRRSLFSAAEIGIRTSVRRWPTPLEPWRQGSARDAPASGAADDRHAPDCPGAIAPMHRSPPLKRAGRYCAVRRTVPRHDMPCRQSCGRSFRPTSFAPDPPGRGRHVSDCIWKHRPEAEAKCVADPVCAHLPIGGVACGSGFAGPVLFVHRFRKRSGVAPGGFRHTALARPRDPSIRGRPPRSSQITRSLRRRLAGMAKSASPAATRHSTPMP